MPYKLSATLTGHTSDARLLQVRALCAPTNDVILSASRDSTAVVWRRASTASKFASDVVFHASTRYVNSVAYLPPTSDAPKGYVVTGDQNGVINVYSLEPTKDDPDYTLLGHTNNVCGLRTTPAGNIISCSWDSTARVWKNFNLEYELNGHENSVWDVVAINEDEFLTCSADKTIKLWQQHKIMRTFSGHDAVIRSLALIPDIGFASCAANEIRVWSLGGDLLHTLTGHTSYIYQLAVLPNGDLVSSGEDRSVRVWKGRCSDIEMVNVPKSCFTPAVSVWTVSILPNGDIVSGSSDKTVRVFSASEDRWAPAEEIEAYEDAVAPQPSPNAVQTTEALNKPGRQDGQTMQVLNGNVTEVHYWDGSVWEKIGERIGSASDSKKPKPKTFEGKEYGYVWDVAIEDGEPAFKLPYNISALRRVAQNLAEDPATAARRFLERSKLPLRHVDTVIEFIHQNTMAQTLSGY
ncbi:WD-40 repeat-containing protein [Mycena olivaceomarginata]|nr:WD-40 repeat-containing protein [Mycena olivaceomarginata]